MKLIVFFLILGVFLNSSYADDLESEIAKEESLHETWAEHQYNFSRLVEATMDLMGPDSSTTQSTDQITAQTTN